MILADWDRIKCFKHFIINRGEGGDTFFYQNISSFRRFRLCPLNIFTRNHICVSNFRSHILSFFSHSKRDMFASSASPPSTTTLLPSYPNPFFVAESINSSYRSKEGRTKNWVKCRGIDRSYRLLEWW